ncbi:MAG: hypothetical protein K0Q72_4112, partial [Armatimonadetes bacterium]|nr:hypothetical protein [Armatimonadota bacterium]
MLIHALKEKSSQRRWVGGLLALALAGVIAPLPPARAQAPDSDKKVTVNLRDIPLRSAVDSLFAGTGLQYSVDPNVMNVPVNLTLRDVGVQAALRLLVRQAASVQPGLTFSKDGDIYQIRVRQAVVAAPVPEDLPPEFTAEKTEFTWEKIPIQFNNVAVFVMAFGGQMLPSEADVLMGGQGGGGMNGMNGGMNGMNGGGMMGGM